MVRAFNHSDIDEVAKIWLDANLEAHDFIPAQYWKRNFAAVRGLLLKAELYVYEEAGRILGFIGLDGSFIAGIFVCRGARSCGIGKRLLDTVKAIKTELSLSVYQKNIRAIKLYQREGFVVQREAVDDNTDEPEYIMVWKAA